MYLRSAVAMSANMSFSELPEPVNQFLQIFIYGGSEKEEGCG